MNATYVSEATDDQVNWGYCQDPRGVLKLGETYEIDRVDVHGWHTKLFLVGVDSGRGFNSVNFDWPRSDYLPWGDQ